MKLSLHRKSKRRPCGAPVRGGTCPVEISDSYECYWHPDYNDEQPDDHETGSLTFAERLEAGTRGDRPKVSEIFKALGDRGRAAA